MPIEVELPDGSIAEFPDGTSHDVMKSAISKRFAPQPSARQVAEAEVRSGENRPDYRPPSMFGDKFQRLSDQVMDPFGVQDEIVGAGQFARKFVTSGGSLDEASKAYSDAAERVRAERRVARQDYGIAPDIVGGFGTAGAVGRGVAAAPTFLQGVRQSAQAGAAGGAVSGFAQGEGGVTNRLLGAAEGGAIGAVAAPVIGNVLLPAAARTIGGIRDATRYAANAIQSARNPQQTAIETVADRIVASGTTPDAIRARVGPQSPTPMNIIDITKEIAGEGGSSPVTRLGRAAYSLAGDEAGDSAERLMSRQATQSGRVSNIIQRSVANPTQRALGGNTAGDFEATRAAGLQKIKDEAGPAYKQFYAEPDLATDKLGDLMEDPLFKRMVTQAQRQERVDIIKRNQVAARTGKAQEPVPYTNKNDPEIRRLQDEIRSSQDAMRNAQRTRQDEALSRSKGTQAAPESDDEVNSLVDFWKYIREVDSRKKPESLSSFVVRMGGIDDSGGDILSAVGRAKDRPGLIRKKSIHSGPGLGIGGKVDNANSLDAMALRAWENGFFPGRTQRPTKNEFIDMLTEDLQSSPVYRDADAGYRDDWNVAREMERELEKYGISPAKFRSEDRLKSFLVSQKSPSGKSDMSASRSRMALNEMRDHQDKLIAARRKIADLQKDNPQVFSPKTLDFIQRELRLASEQGTNPNRANYARNMREVFLDRIEDHYPTFRGIRERYATGMGEFGADGALEAGAALTTKLGAPSREALRDFDRFTPAQQELFRLGFARKLMDDAANTQTGASVANKFNSPAVREIVERLYPRSDPQLWRQGQEMLRGLRREGITTRTKNDMLAGARTAELSSDMSRMTEGARAAADALSGRWGQLLNNLSTRLTTQIGRRGAREVADILTQTDPAQLGATLDRLARSARTTQQRQAYVTAIRELRALNIPGVSLQVGEQSGRSRAKQ